MSLFMPVLRYVFSGVWVLTMWMRYLLHTSFNYFTIRAGVFYAVLSLPRN